MIILSVVYLILVIAIIVNIVLIARNKTNHKDKLINKFCLGFSLMLVSFLGGFSLGAYIIFFAIVVWANVLINNYDNTKIKLAAYVLLAVIFVETWFLKPG